MNKINISLGITAVATLAMFFLPNVVSANAQNATTASIDVDSIKPHLDQAKNASDIGDYPTALKHIELAEEQLEIAENALQKGMGMLDLTDK
jgi:hypothetical protein